MCTRIVVDRANGAYLASRGPGRKVFEKPSGARDDRADTWCRPCLGAALQRARVRVYAPRGIGYHRNAPEARRRESRVAALHRHHWIGRARAPSRAPRSCSRAVQRASQGGDAVVARARRAATLYLSRAGAPSQSQTRARRPRGSGSWRERGQRRQAERDRHRRNGGGVDARRDPRSGGGGG